MYKLGWASIIFSRTRPNFAYLRKQRHCILATRIHLLISTSRPPALCAARPEYIKLYRKSSIHFVNSNLFAFSIIKTLVSSLLIVIPCFILSSSVLLSSVLCPLSLPLSVVKFPFLPRLLHIWLRQLSSANYWLVLRLSVNSATDLMIISAVPLLFLINFITQSKRSSHSFTVFELTKWWATVL